MKKILLATLLCLALILTACGQKPAPPETSSPSVEPPEAPTEETSLPKNEMEKLTHPCLISLGGTPDGKSLVYTLVYEFTASDGRRSKEEPLDYNFPLFVMRAEEGKMKQTLAIIPDPELQEIGAEWLSDIIQDPVYEDYLLRVKLIRVEKLYEYQMELHTSGDNGQSWQGHDFAWPFD